MIRGLVAWPLALAAAAWAVARHTLEDSAVEIVALIAFTPQATAGALLALLICVGLRRWTAAAVAGLAAAALVVAVAPRALGSGDDRAGPDLRLVSVNARLGQASPQALLALARRTGADAVFVSELTPEMVAAVDAAGFAGDYPHRVLRPESGGTGIGLYSRHPLESPRGQPGGVAAATARIPGAAPVELVSVHPRSPRNETDYRRWRTGLRALPLASRTGPLRVMAGDFNATLDHSELRRIIDSGYADAADAVGKGLQPTWPETRRIPAAVTIDHVLADERVAVRGFGVQSLPGTDHRALTARLGLPPG